MQKVMYYMDEGYTQRKVNQEATWAAKIVKTYGGWLAFESMTDYLVWKNQK